MLHYTVEPLTDGHIGTSHCCVIFKYLKLLSNLSRVLKLLIYFIQSLSSLQRLKCTSIIDKESETSITGRFFPTQCVLVRRFYILYVHRFFVILRIAKLRAKAAI